MSIKEPVTHLIEQLIAILNELSDAQYTNPVPILSDATIGQHTRHIIEFYETMIAGYEEGIIDYDQRKRDHSIESQRLVAIRLLKRISGVVDLPDKSLLLATGFNNEEGHSVLINTNYHRELLYNLEHTIHHMAILRVAINVQSGLTLQAEFGVAASTIKFRKSANVR